MFFRFRCVTVGAIVLLVSVFDCRCYSCQPSQYSYDINTDRTALWTGCYYSASGSEGVFPVTGSVSLSHKIDWDRWKKLGHADDIIKKCGELALQKGVYNFGVKNYGECYFGNNPNLSQGEVTSNDHCDIYCKWDVGGPDTMVVYNLAWIDRNIRHTIISGTF